MSLDGMFNDLKNKNEFSMNRITLHGHETRIGLSWLMKSIRVFLVVPRKELMRLIKRCHHLEDKRHLAAVLSKPETPGIATTGYSAMM